MGVFIVFAEVKGFAAVGGLFEVTGTIGAISKTGGFLVIVNKGFRFVKAGPLDLGVVLFDDVTVGIVVIAVTFGSLDGIRPVAVILVALVVVAEDIAAGIVSPVVCLLMACAMDGGLG